MLKIYPKTRNLQKKKYFAFYGGILPIKKNICSKDGQKREILLKRAFFFKKTKIVENGPLTCEKRQNREKRRFLMCRCKIRAFFFLENVDIDAGCVCLAKSILASLLFPRARLIHRAPSRLGGQKSLCLRGNFFKKNAQNRRICLEERTSRSKMTLFLPFSKSRFFCRNPRNGRNVDFGKHVFFFLTIFANFSVWTPNLDGALWINRALGNKSEARMLLVKHTQPASISTFSKKKKPEFYNDTLRIVFFLDFGVFRTSTVHFRRFWFFYEKSAFF